MNMVTETKRLDYCDKLVAWMHTCRLTFLPTTRCTVAGTITATCSGPNIAMILVGSSARQKVKGSSR